MNALLSTDRFIETEAVRLSGGDAEQAVWQALKAAFAERECFGYWRFPVFSRVGQSRKEPDILLIDRELGLIVVEVKGIRIGNLERIHGHTWMFQSFYEPQGQPYQQAENQLYQLLGFCDSEPSLRRRVRARVLVALPFITRDEWEARGLHRNPACPPILFKDDLRRPLGVLESAPPVQSAAPLEEDGWERLQQVIAGKTLFRRQRETGRTPKGRALAVHLLRSNMHALDLQQEHIGKQIPPGPQRIRGIAGSGKTVLLCQKAALMHLRYPEWDIALTFFTQSLYDPILKSLDQWMRHFSGGRSGYSPDNPKLRVLHAWGRRGRAGLYQAVAARNGLRFHTVASIPPAERGSPLENYAWALRGLLEEARAKGKRLQPLFDAVLVDEGQDLVFEERYKFEGRQPFYWMALQSLRPAQTPQGQLFEETDAGADLRRLIWAYDEAQSLDSLLIPTARELFGEDHARMVQGTYFGGIRKSEVMKSCYRTPGPILVAAHALGMGLLRPGGVVSSISTREGWEEIGYRVEGRFSPPGGAVRLERLEECSPNPVPRLWEQPVLTFSRHRGRFEEVGAIAERIKADLEEGFAPSRDLLAVVLGRDFESVGRMLGQALNERGIAFYVPKAARPNSFDRDGDAGDFWREGAVTLASAVRAKGNEAEVVYAVGLDRIAEREAHPEARNQLFVALTRSRAFAHLSGVGQHPLYDEVERVIASGASFSFTYRQPKREIVEA